MRASFSFSEPLCGLPFSASLFMKVKVKESEVAQPCLTLCDPVDCSLPGSSIHGILQARILKWVAISFSKGIFLTQRSSPGLPHSWKYHRYLKSSVQSQIKIPFVMDTSAYCINQWYIFSAWINYMVHKDEGELIFLKSNPSPPCAKSL